MTEEQVEKVISHWSTEWDTWQGDRHFAVPGEATDNVFNYPPAVSWRLDKGETTRPLPEYYAGEARRYIETYCTKYPLQLRLLLGLPMWLRFCHTWQRTGNWRKAMRAI